MEKLKSKISSYILPEYVQDILFLLRKNKKRTISTGLGVAGAIFLLVVLMAMGNGLEEGVKNRFKNIQTNSLFLYSDITSLPYKQLKAERNVDLNNSDFIYVKNNFEKSCSIITARKILNDIKYIYLNMEINTTCNLIAVDYNIMATRILKLIHGRFINQNDITGKNKNIVLGKETVSDLFKKESPIGKKVKVDNTFYTVIGVIESMKDGDAVKYDNNCVFIPLSTYQYIYNDNTISNIDIVPLNDKYDRVKAQALNSLKIKKNISITDEKGIIVTDTKKDYAKYTTLFENIRYFIWFVSLCMLILGIININNVMTIAINERMKEIAIKKAIGATPENIIKDIIIESLILTSISGMIGMIVGLSLVELVAFIMKKMHIVNEFFMYPHVNFSIIILSILLLIISGLLAGYFPAKYASSIKPIKILRND